MRVNVCKCNEVRLLSNCHLVENSFEIFMISCMKFSNRFYGISRLVFRNRYSFRWRMTNAKFLTRMIKHFKYINATGAENVCCLIRYSKFNLRMPVLPKLNPNFHNFKETNTFWSHTRQKRSETKKFNTKFWKAIEITAKWQMSRYVRISVREYVP